MYSGAIKYDVNLEPSVLANALADCLLEVDAKNVFIMGNFIFFTGGIFRLVSNWNVLGPFGRGELEIDPVGKQVLFRLSLAQSIITSFLSAAGLGIFMIAVGAPIQFVATFLPVIWIVPLGANYFTGVSRFSSFLNKSITSIGAANQALKRTG